MTTPVFDRSFETRSGFLRPEHLPAIDWTRKTEIEQLFPSYKREMLALEASGAKNISKNVDIEDFDLRLPGNFYLFKDTSLKIEARKRSAMYGANGSGKTSLFEAITAGTIKEFPKHLHVHHMKELEHNEAADAVSVLDTVLCSHPLRRVLLVCEEILTAKIEDETKNESKSDALAAYQDNLAYIQLLMRGIDGYTGVERARQNLRVLGFDDFGESQPLSSLSGGLRMRVALCSAFFIDPELLLLDEPTNHLDFPSVLWLENRLRGYKGAFVVVTHDRTLLENVCTSVLLLQDKAIHYFSCGFAEFEKRKAKMDDEKEAMIDKFMQRNRNLDSTSPLARTKMEYTNWRAARHARQMMLACKFTFKPPTPLPNPTNVEQSEISLIKVENVRFSYDVAKGLPFIFDIPISYDVKLGSRLGVMGPNGAGKSTFLKLITGKLQATEGKITVNPDFTLAYFGQHSTKELDMEETPIEFMQRMFPEDRQGLLLNHLEKTSIVNTIANTRMANLSFSQRSCVIFSKLTYVPPHLLIMDEPTNFLDLDSVDSLISATNKFQGALIVVTHNRDFLKRCAKNFLSIVPGQFLEYDNMKDAERSTYSFIAAMEDGKQIDLKNAIVENRGGGALETDESRAQNAARLSAAQKAAEEKKMAEELEAERVAKHAADKAAKAAAKIAAQKLDWKEGDVCFAPVGTNYVKGVVKRNVPAMGVSVELSTGKTIMVDAKKLKEENPSGPQSPPAAAPAPQQKKGGPQQQNNNNNNKGKGQAQGAANNGGGRGAAQAARGGGRGGRK